MNIDIRLSLDFFDHPKTKKLSKRLGLEGVFSLLKLWSWVSGNRSTGILTSMDAEDVELAADWGGEDGLFVQTLLALRLLDENEGVYAIHDWEDHQAYASKSEERSSKSRKAAEARWNKATEVPSNTDSNAQRMPGDATSNAQRMPGDATSNAQRMPGDATSNAASMGEHTFSNAPKTKSQEPNFNITTPDGVVVDAAGVSPSPPPGGGCLGGLLEPVERDGNAHGNDRASPAAPPACPPCPHERIVAAWHEALPELSGVKVWDGTRKTHLQARWRERWKAGKYASQAEGLAYWTRLFRHVRKCDWLMGRVTGRNGRAFKATLGWLVRPENFAKLIEGRYDPDPREVAA